MGRLLGPNQTGNLCRYRILAGQWIHSQVVLDYNGRGLGASAAGLHAALEAGC